MLKNIIRNVVKWKKVILALVIFFVLVLILINSIKNGKTSALSNRSFNFFTNISKGGKGIRSFFSGHEEENQLEKLKEENAQLRKELIENTMGKQDIEQLTQLKNALHFVNDSMLDSFVSAEIIAKNTGNYYRSFTLSAGSKDGVKQDSIVVDGQGLVGRVYQVSEKYCKAISIIDNRASLSFEIVGRGEDTGLLSQDIKMAKIEDESLIKGYMFDVNSGVKEGEMVVTSGLGLYPAGIPIGKVSQIIPDNQNLLKYILVEPYVDLKKLNKVLIFNKRDAY